VKLHAVIGGFHLSGITEPAIPHTVRDLAGFGLDLIIPAHCTGWRAVNALERAFGERVVLPSGCRETVQPVANRPTARCSGCFASSAGLAAVLPMDGRRAGTWSAVRMRVGCPVDLFNARTWLTDRRRLPFSDGADAFSSPRDVIHARK
jgi:hypothetical protein